MSSLPFEIINADCREAMAAMDPDTVDAIVTDPPYGLGFMGKGWDHGVPGVDFWAEALRVLKPGGHLLAFGGTRTFHRLTVAIEDAGFEVRDCLSWMYGSGFPKSMDVSKAIDKAAGARRTACADFAPDTLHPEPAERDICTTCHFHKVDHAVGDHEGTVDFGMKNRCSKCGKPFFSASPCVCPKPAPATPEAEQWQGWGTALKPAWEPIIVARKPLIGTVAANVLEHGTGAINVDATRIETTDDLNGGAYSGDLRKRDEYSSTDATEGAVALSRLNRGAGEYVQPSGRWPANVMLAHHEDCVEVGTKRIKAIKGGNSRQISNGEGRYNWNAPDAKKVTPDGVDPGYGDAEGMETVPAFDCHPDCPVRLLDEQTGTLTSGKATIGAGKGRADNATSIASTGKVASCFADKGGASRFFYNAKVSKKERNLGLPDGMKNGHPTCKPVAVMAWLCRLVTPTGGTVLDPFMGSGSTGVAALNEGFRFVGVDNEADYCEIARHRIGHAAGAEVIRGAP